MEEKGKKDDRSPKILAKLYNAVKKVKIVPRLSDTFEPLGTGRRSKGRPSPLAILSPLNLFSLISHHPEFPELPTSLEAIRPKLRRVNAHPTRWSPFQVCSAPGQLRDATVHTTRYQKSRVLVLLGKWRMEFLSGHGLFPRLMHPDIVSRQQRRRREHSL